MKKKLFMYGFVALTFGLVSCKSQQKEVTNTSGDAVSTADNSRNSLDWDGTYSGITPCADCTGIQTTIELTIDRMYKISRIYLGREDSRFDASGKFEWDQTGNIITLGEGDDMLKLRVGEGALIMLNREGDKITGELAENYTLTKLDMALIEKYWKLTELFGEPITTTEGSKEVYMLFKAEGNRVHGNSGCNSFNGTYTLKPGNRISFSQMASTMMMCPNMDTENKMDKVFEMTDNYVVKGDMLVLNKARMAPLARFEVVLLK